MYNSRKIYSQKIIPHLFVLGSIQGVPGNFYLGLTHVTMNIQTIRSAEQESYNTKYFQIKQENGRIYPTVGDVLKLGVFDLYWLIYY
jgi:hypothetical protein